MSTVVANRRVFTSIVFSMVFACAQTSEEPTANNPAPGEDKKPPAPKVELVEQNAPRLLRRLSLDILGQLPEAADRKAVRANPNSTTTIARSYMQSQQATMTLAQNFRWVWGLRAYNFPDLELMITQGDLALSAALTTDVRHAIAEEPVQLARYIFSKQLPFGSLFTAEYSIAQPSVLSLWGMTQVSQPWPGESIYFGQHADARPASGLLTTQGFLAGFASEQRSDLRARTWDMLQTLTCVDHDYINMHEFHNVADADLTGDLATYASNTAPCATCHRHSHPVAPAFHGLASDSSFATWLSYSPNTTPEPGYYAGHEFTGLDQLGTLASRDPRIVRCSLQKLQEAVTQRAFNDGSRPTPKTASDAHDMQTLIKAMNTFSTNNKQIPVAWQELFFNRDYSSGLVNDTTIDQPKATSFETKFLNRHQWSSIAIQLVGSTAGLSLTDDLDPGSSDSANPEYRVTNGAYWHATNRIARQIATAIVAQELADLVQPSSRKLLTLLPDGAGNSASAETIRAQIVALWEQLTSLKLASDHAQIENLYQLWVAASANNATPTAHRDAWRTTITGILLSDYYVTY